MYIIRNAAGEIVGECTNRPGEGNKLPDGSPEVIEFVEADTPEILKFRERSRAASSGVPALRERMLTELADSDPAAAKVVDVLRKTGFISGG